VAAKSYVCVKCGKPFLGAQAALFVIGILSLFFWGIFLINIFVGLTDTYSQIEGTLIANEDVLLVSIMGAFLVPTIGSGALKGMSSKHGPNSRSMVCPKCKEAAANVAKEEQAKLQKVVEAKAWEWTAKVEDVEKNDVWAGKLISSWKSVNPDKVPSEAMVQDLNMARNLEKAGNYEGAAVILERYQFWEEAGRVRKLDDQKIIKHITVDMNELIDQVSTKGLAIPYKCRSCGASITIDKDSRKEGLKSCSYCGTMYNIEDMTKIIQRALE